MKPPGNTVKAKKLRQN